ncbi:hypothetical protein TNCT_624791 [Trichonephila clavata]|uniref:Uncharacterized protein n=1 Tax=Trichonephila clavata TaxID=2740835 RepID=A0A8X6G8Q1_TRICU|nr:hypothetical protein TNCT_624791 [Trichonephila clavata]
MATLIDDVILQQSEIDKLYVQGVKESCDKGNSESVQQYHCKELRNPIICSCNVRWINTTTILANVTIKGTCSSKSHRELLIRSAVRYWMKWCDENGDKITRKKPSYTSPISLYLEDTETE